MCEKCGQAVNLLKKRGLSEKEVMDILWSETAFPAADGDFVLKQVKQFIKKQKKTRDK